MAQAQGGWLGVSNPSRGISVWVVTLALSTAWLQLGCSPQPSAEDRIKLRGELRVVTLNSPTSYYLGAQGEEGFDYELASRFAHDMGVKLVMYAVSDERAMQAELATGRADVAAAQLSTGYAWAHVGQVSAPYDDIPQLIVYRKGKTRPHETTQLELARGPVGEGSPQEPILQRLNRTVAPNRTWIPAGPRAADPLDDVANGQAD